MSLEIIIGADVVPTASNTKEFQKNAPRVLFNGLDEVWAAADARIFNLESPLTDESNAVQKCGPNLCAPTACAEGIAALNPTGVCICNNHIYDYGAEGLLSTRAALRAKHVASFGAGADLDEADQAFFFVKNGVRVGVYAVCEHEFSFATERRAGANPLNLINFSDRLREIKSSCDRMIVLYHGGREGYEYPSPELQKICRKAAECGASLVICQHSHCIGSSERWNNATIVYGQGNFIFDVPNAKESFYSGFLIRYIVGDYGADKVEYVPIVRVNGGAEPASAQKAEELLEQFDRRSKRLRVEGFVSARYEKYAATQNEKLFHVFLSGNRFFRALNVLTGRKPMRLYSRRSLVNILNTLRCESIHELLVRGLLQNVSPNER